MKRVKAACICQTLHFMLKEDVAHDYAVRLVQDEVAHYKKNRERNHTRYRSWRRGHSLTAPSW